MSEIEKNRRAAGRDNGHPPSRLDARMDTMTKTPTRYKAGRPPTNPRKETHADIRIHAYTCKICNHPAKSRIEKHFREFVPKNTILKAINAEFPEHRFSLTSLNNHILAFDLDRLRTTDTRNVINHVVNSNLDKLRDLSPTDALRALELQGKAEGIFIEKHQVEHLENKNTSELRALLTDTLKELGVEAEYEVESENDAEQEENDNV